MSWNNGTAWGFDSDPAEDWRDGALCRSYDPEMWFPVGESARAKVDNVRLRAQVDAAKAVCRMCPVSQQCLRWALAAGITDGIWGGKTPSERRHIKSPNRLGASR